MPTATASPKTTAAKTFTLVGVRPGGMKERHGFRPMADGTVELIGRVRIGMGDRRRHVRLPPHRPKKTAA